MQKLVYKMRREMMEGQVYEEEEIGKKRKSEHGSQDAVILGV